MLSNFIEPQTTIKLLKGVPLDPDYRHTVYFEDARDQLEYFASFETLMFDNQSYQRINKGQLRLEVAARGSAYDSYMSYNYLTFKNTGYEAKPIYAFITSIDYVNDNTIQVTYEIDIMQTFAFDYKILPSYVEREIPRTDTPGDNLIPENLERGEYSYKKASSKGIIKSGVTEGSGAAVQTYRYSSKAADGVKAIYAVDSGAIALSYPEGHIYEVVGNSTDLSYLTVKDTTTDTELQLALTALYMDMGDTTKSNWCILVASSIAIENPDYIGRIRNGIYSGLSLIRFPSVDAANAYIQAITDAGLSDSIVSIAMAPSFIYDATTGAASFDIDDISRPSALGSYTPRNNKLLTAPYQTLFVKSSDGVAGSFPYEYFENPSEPIFRLYGAASATSELALEPMDYKGLTGANDNERMNVSSAPLCSYVIDTYRAWLAQTQAIRENSISQINEQRPNAIMNAKFSALGTVAGSVGTGAALGAAVGSVVPVIGTAFGSAVGGVLGGAVGLQRSFSNYQAQVKQYDYQIDNINAEVAQHLLDPPQARGSISGSLDIALGMFGYQIYHAQITPQFAKIIDDYFSVYGYAAHRVKSIDRANRKRWTFIRTKGANVTSDGDGVNAEITSAIAAILDAGITFWRYAPSEFTIKVGEYQDANGSWYDNSIR